MSKEIWKPIPGWSRYLASSNGRIKRVDGGKIILDKSEGRVVKLFDNDGKIKTVVIAILILYAFKGPPPTPRGVKSWQSVGRHLNDIPTDNRIKNLAWGTPKDNSRDACLNRRRRLGLPAIKTRELS